MLTLVQLNNGCYRLVIDIVIGDSARIHREYVMESIQGDDPRCDADAMPNGEYLELEIKYGE